jgi:hypothetical protein
LCRFCFDLLSSHCRFCIDFVSINYRFNVNFMGFESIVRGVSSWRFISV